MMTLSLPRVDRGRLRIRVSGGAAARYLATDELCFDYGDLDLSVVPPSVLAIPAIGTLLPIALAAGADLQVPALDAVFADQLPLVAAYLRGLYPQLPSAGGRVHGRRVSDRPHPIDPTRITLLYSGGIDSLASLLRHREAVGGIVAVWGADVELEDRRLWDRLEVVRAAAPVAEGTRRVVVRSNLRAGIDELRLNRDFDRLFTGPDWWGGIQHGLALTTLAVPVAHALGSGRVMIASSHSTGFDGAWGSKPGLDELVRWGGGVTIHDSYDLNRQDKLDLHVAPWLRAGQPLTVPVCFQPNRGSVDINCLRCEKCIRSASGLLVAGVDPALAGLPVSHATLQRWRADVIGGRVSISPAVAFQWQSISGPARDRAAAGSSTGPSGYTAWLGEFDFATIAAPSPPRDGVGALPWWRYRALRAVHRLDYPLRRPLRERLG